MALNPLIEYDWRFTDFAAQGQTHASQGWRLLSLSMYGDPFDSRFSAVWDKRAGPPWRWSLGFTVPDLQKEYNKNRTEGFYPSLVTATGAGANTRMSAVFEKLAPPKTRELTFDQDVDAFATEVWNRAKAGWIMMSATIYDDLRSASRVAAVWAKNSGNVAWRAVAGLTATEFQEHFNAQWSGWARLAFATGSTRGRFLCLYRDDQLGPIGSGFVARYNLSLDDFLAEHKTWLSKGFHTICFQGYGSLDKRQFGAIFVNNEVPVPRTVRAPTGGPAVPDIDNAVLDLMKRSNIRGAALAIVKGTTLVLARGYTWAEPDYPTVQPTTCFRLGSGSKLVATLALYQLVAEGVVKLNDKVSSVLPLSPPAGMTIANTRYLNGTVAQLIEAGNILSPRYEGEGPNIAALGGGLPVTHAQIASYMITKPTINDPNAHLDDFGYFLMGQIIKKARGVAANKSIMEAINARLTNPLQIKRIRSGRSLIQNQPKDEARYHSRDLELHRSVMDGTRPLVPREYGDENLETMETSGGLSAAAPDLARLLAAMNAKPYTPLGRTTVDQLLKNAAAADGHGFDWLDPIDARPDIYNGPKGGLLQSSQAGLWYSGDGFSYAVIWNGLHTGNTLELDGNIGPEWYPKFIKVLDAAAKQAWSKADLFPTYEMDSFPQIQDNWRWCNNCQGLFFAGTNLGSCPAGGQHIKSGVGNYALMHSSKLPYGQANWRWCKKCQGLFFGGSGANKCPAGGAHDKSASADYRLVLDSPYHEHQPNWRWCKKCQGLFFSGKKKSVCKAGGAHDPSSSGNYSLAWS